jgi:ferritin
MLNPEITDALNQQVQLEAQSSHSYLAMAVWAETAGYDGTATFLYRHAEEERVHMLKLIRFINERGSKAVVPALSAPSPAFSGLKEAFESVLDHETRVTQSINEVVDLCLKVKDYPTYNFMQWYVAEQLEEEGLARRILDRLALAGDASGALYHFDRDITTMEAAAEGPTA